jgi:hypothetical protein
MTGLSVGAPFFPCGYGQPLAHGTDPANSRDNWRGPASLSVGSRPFFISM